MKKLMTIVLMLFCVTLGTQAQTIKVGDKFWDGSGLYTVQEIRMGTIVYMTQRNVPSVLHSSVGAYSISVRTV